MSDNRSGHTVSAVRFAVPIAIENTVTTLIGMISSALIGGISVTSLAAAGTSNTIISFLVAALSLLTTGSAIIISREVGAGDRAAASKCIEQSLLLTILLSGALTLLIEIFAHYVLKLLIPTAEPSLFNDTKAYLRVIMISYPFMMLMNVGVSILRAAGDSRSTMYTSIAMNVIQIGCVYLFVNVIRMDVFGAALAYVCCRFAGCVMVLVIVVRSTSRYHIHIPNIFRPDVAEFKTIIRIGMPNSLEQLSVQGGYLLANSLAVGLGTEAASIYQVVNSLIAFPAIPMGIMQPAVLTVVGQYIGAGEYEKARRSEYNMWLFTIITCTALGVIEALLGTRLTGLYTKDAHIAEVSALLLWVQLGYQLFGGSINALDPALRAGGENRFVMFNSSFCVWCIRLPLSWLLGYALHFGIWGITWANVISLTIRAIIGVVKRSRNTWIHESI